MNWMMTNKPPENPSFKVSGISTRCLFRYVIFLSFLIFNPASPLLPYKATQTLYVFSYPWTPTTHEPLKMKETCVPMVVDIGSSDPKKLEPREAKSTPISKSFFGNSNVCSCIYNMVSCFNPFEKYVQIWSWNPKDRAENSKNLWNHWIENKLESAADVFFLIRDLFNKTWQFWGKPWPSSGFLSSVDKKVTFFLNHLAIIWSWNLESKIYVPTRNLGNHSILNNRRMFFLDCLFKVDSSPSHVVKDW